jgi:hypothetical protein
VFMMFVPLQILRTSEIRTPDNKSLLVDKSVYIAPKTIQRFSFGQFFEPLIGAYNHFTPEEIAEYRTLFGKFGTHQCLIKRFDGKTLPRAPSFYIISTILILYSG